MGFYILSLLYGVAFDGVGGFRNVFMATNFIQSHHGEESVEQLGNFLDLSRVACGKYKAG